MLTDGPFLVARRQRPGAGNVVQTVFIQHIRRLFFHQIGLEAEIAQGVEDGLAAVDLHRLQLVGTAAEHRVRAAVDHRPAEFLHVGGGLGHRLAGDVVRVDHHHHVIRDVAGVVHGGEDPLQILLVAGGAHVFPAVRGDPQGQPAEFGGALRQRRRESRRPGDLHRGVDPGGVRHVPEQIEVFLGKADLFFMPQTVQSGQVDTFIHARQ